MEALEDWQLVGEFCASREWPKRSQVNGWVYSRHPIAIQCFKKVGGRYIINVTKFNEFVRNATLDERTDSKAKKSA